MNEKILENLFAEFLKEQTITVSLNTCCTFEKYLKKRNIKYRLYIDVDNNCIFYLK